MNGFEVDPARLRTAAIRVGDLAQDCAGRRPSRYSADPALTGDALLGIALGRLQAASSEATSLVFADAGELAERLARASRLYAECQDEVKGRIHRLTETLDRPGTAG